MTLFWCRIKFNATSMNNFSGQTNSIPINVLICLTAKSRSWTAFPFSGQNKWFFSLPALLLKRRSLAAQNDKLTKNLHKI